MRLLPDECEEVSRMAATWKSQYFRDCNWVRCIGDSETIYNRLAALPAGAVGADVAAIIGNDSWIGQSCTECGTKRAVVLVGQEPDYESNTAYLCSDCVTRLGELVKGAT